MEKYRISGILPIILKLTSNKNEWNFKDSNFSTILFHFNININALNWISWQTISLMVRLKFSNIQLNWLFVLSILLNLKCTIGIIGLQIEYNQNPRVTFSSRSINYTFFKDRKNCWKATINWKRWTLKFKFQNVVFLWLCLTHLFKVNKRK